MTLETLASTDNAKSLKCQLKVWHIVLPQKMKDTPLISIKSEGLKEV